MLNQLLCWWYGHEWMPVSYWHTVDGSESGCCAGTPPPTAAVKNVRLVYHCDRCHKEISRDEYDQWERKI